MTKKEIQMNTTWDEFEMGTCRLFVEVLNQYIPVIFFQDHKPKPSISVKMLKSINDILALDENEFDRLKAMLGEEVYLQSKIKEIHIDQENDNFDGAYSEVIMNSVSNSVISVIVKDSKFICVNDGAYFDTLVVNEKDSEVNILTKESRDKILSMLLSS